MKDKKQLAIFDFDGTLINIQSADYFCLIVALFELKIKSLLKIIFYKSIFFRIYSKFIKSNQNVKYKILQLIKGVSHDKLIKFSKFYSYFLKSRRILKVQEILDEHIKKGDEVVIISAGYGIYLREFFKDKNVFIIASEFDFSDSIFNGSLENKDCLGENKIVYLKEKFNLNSYSKVYAYTDHMSDIPLLLIADYRFIISKKVSLKWGEKLNAQIINYI